VTICADGFGADKGQFCPGGVVAVMTGAAGHSGMFAVKGKFGLAVIELNIRPAGVGVAEFASLVVDKSIKLAMVRVGVADKTAHGGEFEDVNAVFGSVAEITGHGLMGAPEGIIGGIMPGDRESGGGIS